MSNLCLIKVLAVTSRDKLIQLFVILDRMVGNLIAITDDLHYKLEMLSLVNRDNEILK